VSHAVAEERPVEHGDALNLIRSAIAEAPGAEAAAQRAVELLHDRFAHYDWVGIYWLDGSGTELVLGPWIAVGDDPSAGLQQRDALVRQGTRQGKDEAAQQVEAVGAAVERPPWLPAERARAGLHLRAGQIGQVGHDQVGMAVGQGCRLEEVAAGQGHRSAHPMRREVLRCQLEGLGRQVARREPEPLERDGGPEAQGDGERHRSAPSRNLPGLQGGRVAHQPPGDLVDRGLDQQLRLGSRDEGPSVGEDSQGEPLLEAADVCDRLAG